MAFGQADEFTEPVDHLDIDVDVVVAVPRGFVFLVPDALQVGAQTARARATDCEVASEVEVECNERGV